MSAQTKSLANGISADDEKGKRPGVPWASRVGWRGGLSGKLLILTIVFVMISEVLIYVPSIANFRKTQLEELLSRARVAAVVLLSDLPVPEPLTKSLAAETGALAIVVGGENRKRLLVLAEMPPMVDLVVEPSTRSVPGLVVDAFDTLINGHGRVLRIIGEGPVGQTQVQLVMNETRVRQAMFDYSVNIMLLSLIISLTTATLVFLSLRWIIVRPLGRFVSWMEAFASDPENSSTVIRPSGRSDELGVAEMSLASMQTQLSQTLQQKRRLADLGLAVSKINHDLRNILAAAQLFTDRLAASDDPTAKRLAPKLVGILDRAITYTQDVLDYGKAGGALADRRLLRLATVVDEVGSMLGLDQSSTITFTNQINADLEVDADANQLFRVLLNICRNAHQVLEQDLQNATVKRITVVAWRKGASVCIRVSDTGPGLPEKAKRSLFKAFEGTARSGGIGLGLAIAAEIVAAHGGRICLLDQGPGAVFEIIIPDRNTAFENARGGH